MKNKMNVNKKYSIILLSLTSVALIILALIVIIIDPYFHYHGMISDFSYKLSSQRYQNDGITRYFEYDAIITGTSMTENFKTSEFDDLFSVDSIKISLSGARYKEVNETLERAVSYNSNITTIIRGLDSALVDLDKDYERYDEYPTYLYDNNIFNDVNYLFNQNVLFSVIKSYVLYPTLGNIETTTFDDYSNWSSRYDLSKEAVLEGYTRSEKTDEQTIFDETAMTVIYENITQNVTTFANDNPDIDCYYFFTPYSIAWFDDENNNGDLAYYIEALRYATSLILECDNINLYCFFDWYDIICDLDNYRDTTHYGEHINTLILEAMYSGENLLTKDNYEAYFDDIIEFYSNYDYDSIFE